MFLVTTANRKFWPENGKIIFLGEWCKLPTTEHLWGEPHHETLPYHWDDRKNCIKILNI